MGGDAAVVDARIDRVDSDTTGNSESLWCGLRAGGACVGGVRGWKSDGTEASDVRAAVDARIGFDATGVGLRSGVECRGDGRWKGDGTEASDCSVGPDARIGFDATGVGLCSGGAGGG